MRNEKARIPSRKKNKIQPNLQDGLLRKIQRRMERIKKIRQNDHMQRRGRILERLQLGLQKRKHHQDSRKEMNKND